MNSPEPVYPRSVRPAPEPLGLYFRIGRGNQSEFLNVLAAGNASCFGVVLDPTIGKGNDDLRQGVLARKLDVALDPRTEQSALPGSYNDNLGNLPWGVGRRHTQTDFEGTKARRLIAALADYALEGGYTQVLAPTHVLASSEDDWLCIDVECTRLLRNYLDRKGGERVSLIYPLAIAGRAFRDHEQRERLVQTPLTVRAAQVWLQVDGFGSDSSATAIRSYFEAAEDFASLGVPIVGDYIGGLAGLALLSFGAVGGLSHGITLLERFDSSHWRRSAGGAGYRWPTRVYLSALDILLKRDDAKELFATLQRAKALFGCADTNCCPRGTTDMTERPGSHFLYQRMAQVAVLSRIPEQIRPGEFLEQFLRPTTDKALAAANGKWDDEALERRFRETRKRLDSMRVALSQHLRDNRRRAASPLPRTRIAREARVSLRPAI